MPGETTVTATYLGDLHTEAKHGPSGQSFLTDAPVDNNGKGEYFSPTDLVGTSMGTCMLTIMGIQARTLGVRIDGAKVEVVKEMAADKPRRIGKLTVTFYMPGGIEERHQAALERAAHSCPVHKSLHPDIVQDITFAWGAIGAEQNA